MISLSLPPTKNRRALKKLINRTLRLFAPPPRLKVSEYADRSVYLPREGNAEPGKYRITRVPYQREMLDDAIDPDIEEFVWVIASQMGKTLCIIIICEYFIEVAPTSILVVYPTLDSAKAWEGEKFTPTIKETPTIAGLIKDARSRDSGNTKLSKKFPGGNISMAGANSPSGLRQRSKRVIILDEIDAFEDNKEGDPCKQADKRAETFHNAVKLKSSTPTIAGISRVWKFFEATDKQYRFCPCPRCGHFQTLKWSQVQWEKGKTEDAWYRCENNLCDAKLTDQERIEMVKRGEWRATAVSKRKRGRHMNGIYRIMGKKTAFKTYLHEFVEGFLEAQAGGRKTLMVWTNTFLAECFNEDAERLVGHEIAKRAVKYPAEAPQGVLVVTAGVDIQHNRAEIKFKGHGLDGEAWSLLYKVIPGDPAKPEFWKAVDDALSRTFKREDGLELKVAAACIDSGDGATTQYVYQFCKPRFQRRVYATKGENKRGMPIVSKLSFGGRMRCPYYRIGTDTAKGQIYHRLKLKDPGPGYQHFPTGEGLGFTENYFAGLTCEELQRKWVRGKETLVWINPAGARNEPLDCEVLADAALLILQPDWNILKRNLERKVRDYTLRSEEPGKKPEPKHVKPDEKKAPEPEKPKKKRLKMGMKMDWRF